MILSENRYPLFGIMLRRIVHLELDRMRRVLEADDLAHLQVDIAVDEVVVEHAADLEEGAILVELFERLAQRAPLSNTSNQLRVLTPPISTSPSHAAIALTISPFAIRSQREDGLYCSRRRLTDRKSVV